MQLRAAEEKLLRAKFSLKQTLQVSLASMFMNAVYVNLDHEPSCRGK
jgi:hypothetical protein